VDLEVEGVGSNGGWKSLPATKGPPKNDPLSQKGVFFLILKKSRLKFHPVKPICLKNHFENEDKLEEKRQHFDGIYQERCFFFLMAILVYLRAPGPLFEGKKRFGLLGV